jgi:hypothetical protein
MNNFDKYLISVFQDPTFTDPPSGILQLIDIDSHPYSTLI